MLLLRCDAVPVLMAWVCEDGNGAEWRPIGCAMSSSSHMIYKDNCTRFSNGMRSVVSRTCVSSGVAVARCLLASMLVLVLVLVLKCCAAAVLA